MTDCEAKLFCLQMQICLEKLILLARIAINYFQDAVGDMENYVQLVAFVVSGK